MSSSFYWSLPFLQAAPSGEAPRTKVALIILNQPFSRPLLHCLWHASDWRCCADGGANRLHDLLRGGDDRPTSYYLPDLLKGDLDSLRDDVKQEYLSSGIGDQYSTDLAKCVCSLEEKEKSDGVETPYDIVLLGGLSGRLDHIIHILASLHKLRQSGRRIFAVTDDNVGWVLDEAGLGKHHISIDHSILGPTCGLLPVGVDSTVLTTMGLRWNLTNETSGFGGLISTSNHLVPEEDTVFVETSRPIWWVAELKRRTYDEKSRHDVIFRRGAPVIFFFCSQLPS
ncbi:thiamine pyrophosphokinase [Lactarius vividus]|nr:thiamine pyrophosphokinase [Lactarius vividus]